MIGPNFEQFEFVKSVKRRTIDIIFEVKIGIRLSVRKCQISKTNAYRVTWKSHLSNDFCQISLTVPYDTRLLKSLFRVCLFDYNRSSHFCIASKLYYFDITQTPAGWWKYIQRSDDPIYLPGALSITYSCNVSDISSKRNTSCSIVSGTKVSFFDFGV